ncbi:MAG: leucine-rich repeat protein, partial [Clostridia bacterium]|nr:leucine-rich repeat protein [Clostridia bacterium]
MKKTTGIIFAIILTVALSLTLFACGSSGSSVDYSRIDNVTVDESSIEEGFLLSEFDISKVKLNVQYFSTVENGNEVEGEIVQVPVTMNMVKAEDKAKLRVGGTKTIHIVAYSRFELEFTLTLYEDAVVTYKVVFLDEDGSPLQARGDQTGYTQYVAAGGKAIAPTLPTKTGYTFVGWRDRDSGRMSSYDNISKDTTFVAVYEKNVFKVSYYSRVEGKDTLISTANVPREGNALDYAPEIPVLVGYSNGRWDDEASMKSVTGDKNFYAVYDKDQVSVGFTYKRFSANDETDFVKYDVGGQVLNPPGAEYSGFKFVEWRVNGKKVSFPYAVTAEVVFEAYYIPVASGNSGLSYTENHETEGVTVSAYAGEEHIVVIPENVRVDGTVYDVTEIGAGVFKDSAVTDFVVSENNEYFITEDNVLFNRAKTVLLAYPAGRTESAYVIPDSVTTVAPYAFYGASSLRSVVLGANVASIGDYAFANCSALASFAINGSVKSIGDYAFAVEGMESAMTEFTFSADSTLTSVGRYAFAGLSGISSYALPSSLASIGSGAFSGNKSLVSVSAVNNGFFRVSGGALYSADYSTLYVYPALYDGLEYPQVEINARCSRVVSGAFSYAAIESVIASSQITLEYEAFDCPTLRYFRLIDALDMEFSGRSFSDNIPAEIVVPVGASSLHDRLKEISAFEPSVRYQRVDEPSVRSYFSDYFYEQYYYETSGGTRNVGVRILGTRLDNTTLSLPDTLNGNTVTAIADKAFYGNLFITSVTLPVGLQSIGEEAFFGCKNLVSVDFGTEITSIGDRAFAECSALTDLIDKCDGLESFGTDVFRNTPFLTDASDEFVTIGNVLVRYNGYDTTVAVPARVEYLATDSFTGKGQITSIAFVGNGLRTIDSFAFQYCTGLVSVNFPESLRSVKKDAFYGCENLFVVTYEVRSDDVNLTVDAEAYPTVWYDVTQVYTDTEKYTLTYRVDATESHRETGVAFTAPYAVENTAKVRYAGWYEVNESGEITDVLATFPMRLTGDFVLAAKRIDASASSDGLVYRYVEETDSYAVSDYVGVDDYVIVPAQYKNRYVRYIDSYAFIRRPTIRYVELPNRRSSDGSILSEIDGIGANAFHGTEWYNEFNGDFITIDDYLIRYTGTADTIYIPDGVTRLAEGAFANNSSVKTVVFPTGLTSVSDDAFRGCSSLKKVVFPSTLTEIGYAAFSDCVSLDEVNFSDCPGLTVIAYDAFENTAWLNDYIDSCVMINSILYRYLDNPDVHELHIYNGVSLINERAFYNNVYLRSVHVPQSVSAIGESAFEGSSVSAINIFAGGSELSAIRKDAFKDCVNLSIIDLTLSAGLTYIGEGAFSGCYSLRDVTIPATVTELGEGVFMNSGLRTVNFASGSRLTKISVSAFSECSSLFSVNFSGTSALTIIGDRAFYECTALRDFNNLNGSITTIGDYSFYNCVGLTNFSVNANSLREIGDLALENVGYVRGNNRNMVVLGNILIKYNGFETVVEIPSNVTSIYNAAFKGNTRITEIIFPTNSAVTSINAEAFYGCTNLAEINFPVSVVSVGENMMTGTEWYENKLRSGEEYITIANTLVKYNASLIKQAVLPDTVQVINGGAFAGTSVYDILVSDSVYLIKDGAFDGIDTSVYADWTVTMESEDPPTLQLTDPESFSAKYILLPDEATMDGYRLDANWGELYSKMIVPARVRVTFSINESKGTPISPITTNAIYSEIDVETKTSDDLTYIFVGWYLDEEMTEKVVYPLIMPDGGVKEMTLFAKFTDNSQGSNAHLYEVSDDEIRLYGFELDAQGNVVDSDSKIVVIGYLGDSVMHTVGSGYYLDETGHYVYDGVIYDYVDNPGENVDRYSHRGAFENHTELVEV